MMLLRALRMHRRSPGFTRTMSATRAPQRVFLAPRTPGAVSVIQRGCLKLYLSTKPGAVPSSGECLQAALASTGTVAEVLHVWEAHRDSPYSHNLVRSCLYYSLKAAVSERLSTAELFSVAGFDRFWDHLVSQVPSMSANSAVKCLYNCAQFDFHHQTLSASLVDVCTQKSRHIPSVSIGILLWSLKRLDLLSSPSTQPLLTHLVDLFHSRLASGEVVFKTQSLSNILWVLASSNNLPAHLGERVTEVLPRYMDQFDFHSLSLCLWSLTSSGATLTQPLLDSAGTAAAGFLETERSVPNTIHCCWAFASAEYYHRSFCETLSQAILTERSSSPMLTPRLLSSVAWMCAKVGYFNPTLLDCIASRALSKLRQFNAQDLGNLMYAYAQLDYPHQQLVSEVTRRFVSDKKLLSDDGACVSVAWANLAIGEYPLPLLEHLMEPSRVRRLVESGDQNSLNFLLRLQGILRAERPDLHLSLPHHLAVLASALGHSHWSHPTTKLLSSVTTALTKITNTSNGDSNTSSDDTYFTVEALTTTLYSIDIEMIVDERGNPIPVPRHWQCWESLQSLTESALLSRHSPQLQQLLQDTLHRVSSDVVSSPQSLNLASDWAELVGGASMEGVARRVAVEVDGPWHYAANCSHTLGKTLLKHRTLSCLGWTVVSIPYFEWQGLKSEQEQVDYLRTKLLPTDH